MSNLLLLSQLLIISCIYVFNTYSLQVKTWEVLKTSIIRLTDGKPHNFNITSEFIARMPRISIESPDELAEFFVTLTDPNARATTHCMPNINITLSIFNKLLVHLIFCYGQNEPWTLWVPGREFSMFFNTTNSRPKPVELQVLRLFKTTKGNVCQNKTNHQCGGRRRWCLWQEAKCDGQKHCEDGSDERDCLPASNSTYKFRPPYFTNSTNRRRHCDLSDSALYDPHERRYKTNWYWYVVTYSTGIIISTVLCSVVAGFCFMPPYSDEEELELELEHRRRQGLRSQVGERGLDPLLDHPPSYEDVMKMDLSATPHRDAVHKQQDLDSPT